jgi:hypothetical protein
MMTRPPLCRRLLILSALLPLILSCASSDTPPPEWAASGAALSRGYPDAAYIARIGRGQNRQAAELAAAAEIARYFTSRISADTIARETFSQRDGVTSENRSIDASVFVTSEIELFGIRYAPDAFYSKQEQRWAALAYIDRAEAWAVYEPRFKRQADTFLGLVRAAENERDPYKKALNWRAAARFAGQADFEAAAALGQMLHPARMNAVFADARARLAALPQKADEARRNASVFIDCPQDFESLIANAFARAFAQDGFPVSASRPSASAVCKISVDEGMRKGELGIFYQPSLRATLTGKSGDIFSFSASADSVGAVQPDVARRRAYAALAERILTTFQAEPVSGSE